MQIKELDYSLLYQAYSAKGRNPAVNPKTMFKILTYAYSQNIYSSRKRERDPVSDEPFDQGGRLKYRKNKYLY